MVFTVGVKEGDDGRGREDLPRKCVGFSDGSNGDGQEGGGCHGGWAPSSGCVAQRGS